MIFSHHWCRFIYSSAVITDIFISHVIHAVEKNIKGKMKNTIIKLFLSETTLKKNIDEEFLQEN